MAVIHGGCCFLEFGKHVRFVVKEVRFESPTGETGRVVVVSFETHKQVQVLLHSS